MRTLDGFASNQPLLVVQGDSYNSDDDLILIIEEWDPDKHPRGENGRFISGGGGSRSGGIDLRPSGYLDMKYIHTKNGSLIYSVLTTGTISIAHLETKPNKLGKGYAGRLLNRLLEAADREGRRVILDAVAMGFRPDRLNQEQLYQFYERRGFKRKSNNSNAMVRPARKKKKK